MNWKIIWQSLTHADMRNRVLAVLGMLLIFRILAHVPIPLGDPTELKQVLDTLFNSGQSAQLLNFINTISGGALENFSIVLIGLGPYINASIIMQLLTRAIPKLEALNKEGEFGRKKINQYTRLLTLPLAITQAIGAIFLVREAAGQITGLGDITTNATTAQWVLMVASLTGGAMLLMWLGELITEKSVGNGISLLITVGIVSQLPATISSVVSTIFNADKGLSILGKTLPLDKNGLIFAAILLAIVVVVTLIVVKLNEASRNLTINYAKKVQGNRLYGGVTSRLPVKLITAGVIPIIFAVAFLSVPTFAGQLMSGSESLRLQEIGSNLTRWFATPTLETFAASGWQAYIYPVVYFILVFAFTFFYTSITFNAKEIAENLQKQGGFITGIRSGPQTEKYLSKVVNRLTLFGGLALGLLALLPIIGQLFLSSNIAIGGTSVLILVAVALETLRQVESRAMMITYDQYSRDDFFYEAENSAESATGARRLRFTPRWPKKK